MTIIGQNKIRFIVLTIIFYVCVFCGVPKIVRVYEGIVVTFENIADDLDLLSRISVSIVSDVL